MTRWRRAATLTLDGVTSARPAQAKSVQAEIPVVLRLGGVDGEMALNQETQRDFVTGYQDGEPATSPLGTASRLQFTPTFLGEDYADLEIMIDSGELDPDVAHFPVRTSRGKRKIELPTVHLLQVDVGVAAESGQTLVVGGVFSDEARSRKRTFDEILVFAAAQVGAGGDADAVGLKATVLHAWEGDGPATSSVERLGSGPIESP